MHRSLFWRIEDISQDDFPSLIQLRISNSEGVSDIISNKGTRVFQIWYLNNDIRYLLTRYFRILQRPLMNRRKDMVCDLSHLYIYK
jgi:hypothetical protein